MNDRTHLLNYLEWLATQNTSIAHATTSRETRRFFQWGTNIESLLGGYALNNTGWNVLVDLLDGRNIDNKHDYEARQQTIALHFVKHCKAQDLATQNAAIADAYDLGWQWLHRMKQHTLNPCGLPVPPPSVLWWETIKYQELSPLLFIGDQHYGFRFEVTVKTHTDLSYQYVDVPVDGVPAIWSLLVNRPSLTSEVVRFVIGDRPYEVTFPFTGTPADACSHLRTFLNNDAWIMAHFTWTTPTASEVRLVANEKGSQYCISSMETTTLMQYTITEASPSAWLP